MQFEQEKFDTLINEINTLNKELMNIDDYFEFQKVSKLRDVLVSKAESCICIDVNGKKKTIKNMK